EARAAGYWAEAEAVARACDDAVDLVRLLWSLARAALAHDDFARARELVNEAIAAEGRWESFPATELALRYVAGVAAVLDAQPRTPAAHLQHVLVLFERVGTADRFFELSHVILTTAAVLAGTGRTDAAATLFTWAGQDLDVPAYDGFAVRRQRELVER